MLKPGAAVRHMKRLLMILCVLAIIGAAGCNHSAGPGPSGAASSGSGNGSEPSNPGSQQESGGPDGSGEATGNSSRAGAGNSSGRPDAGASSASRSGSSAGKNSSQAASSTAKAESGTFVVPKTNKMFQTVGLYVWDGNPGQHSFWKSCGIDTLVFCDRGWWYNANNGLEDHLKKLTKWVTDAKKDGFKVYMLLFSNLEQYKGPGDTEPTGVGVRFHPNNAAKLNERVSYLRQTVEACKDADGFTLLAGDPGGIYDDMGAGGAQDFVKLAKAVKSMVKQTVPKAKFNINTWAIAYYKTPNSWFDANFWLNETKMTKEIIADTSLASSDIGFEFPTHDYYRPLALRPYAEEIAKKRMSGYPLYPGKADVDALKSRGLKDIWSWPYFLMDEADDGDAGGGARTALPQMETRYIHQYLRQVQGIGINGVIGNWSWSGYANKSLNTYAFGRMANDSTATVDQVIQEYAEFMATKETAPTLVKLLKYIENDSNWQKKLPADRRIANFNSGIASPRQALDLLKTVSANPKPAVSLPESSAKFLMKLKLRLELMLS